jgi:hypothetical protein
MKIWDLERIGKNECSIPFHSLHLNSKTRKWSFHSLLLKLPNKGNERIFLKYSYFSIPFNSFPSSLIECKAKDV